MWADREPGGESVCLVQVEGPLRAPVGGELRETVEAVLRGGHRRLLVDLARVAELDAAGVGELVALYRFTASRKGVLRLARPTPKARKLLDQAGLLGLVDGDSIAGLQSCL